MGALQQLLQADPSQHPAQKQVDQGALPPTFPDHPIVPFVIYLLSANPEREDDSSFFKHARILISHDP
jgi:hypothetical protein